MRVSIDDTERKIKQVLRDLVPAADVPLISSDLKLRDQLDIDSVDIVQFALGLGEAFKIDIPERDYGKLTTVSSCARYITDAQEDRGARGWS